MGAIVQQSFLTYTGPMKSEVVKSCGVPVESVSGTLGGRGGGNGGGC